MKCASTGYQVCSGGMNFNVDIFATKLGIWFGDFLPGSKISGFYFGIVI
jgi:hypothetical protein